MPIEIKELHIKVTVDASAATASASSSGQASPQAADATQAGQDALIAECVEQVLRILEQKKER